MQKIQNNNKILKTFIDIDEDLYVVSINASYISNDNLKRFSLELSNKPKAGQQDLEILANTIQSVQTSTRQQKGTMVVGTQHFKDSFDSNFPAEFMFNIPKSTVYAVRLELKARIRKFRAYSKAIQGGGAVATTTGGGGGVFTTTNGESQSGSSAHQHTITVGRTSSSRATLEASGYKYIMVQPAVIGNSSSCEGGVASIGQLWAANSHFSAPGHHSFKTNCTIDTHTHTFSLPNHVHSFSIPNHTHAMQFGIFENTSSFSDVEIWIDGVNYASELGSWSTLGDKPSASNQYYDLLLAASNLGQLNNLLSTGNHEIEVRCSSGLVMIELFINYEFYLSSR